MSDAATRLNAALEGRYRIERQLGEGGMATVYLARDEKHNRNVALKVLKPELAAVVGADRFLAEIETTANLQHPHILPLFDSGEADSFLFYVMPYVEGESLRDRLDREHQLPVDDAVQIASNVAEALDYAHSQGVIHRDIKPANVLLQAGKPVVSDFGIALALGAAGAGRLTETGLSLGTPHYMSPEQATGDLSVGAASDIYALGCVLYEMLVGEPPFTGGTPQAVLGKIVTGEAPSARDARKAVPPSLDGAIRRALEKVPADRFSAAIEFSRALADPSFRHGDPVGAGSREGGLWNPLSISLSVMLVAATAAAGWALLRPQPSQPVIRFPLLLPPGVQCCGSLAVSPDGRSMTFAAFDGDLYVRHVDQPDLARVGDIDDAFGPFFSPDGQWIGFFTVAGGPLRKVRVDGSGEQTLAEAPGVGRSGVWSSRNTITFGSTALDGLWQVSDVGAGLSSIPGTEGPTLLRLHLLPDETRILAFQETQSGPEMVAVSLATGERTELGRGTTPQYAPGGRLIFWDDRRLWMSRFDADRPGPITEAVPIVDDVNALARDEANYWVSGDLLFYEEGANTGFVPVWLDRSGTTEYLGPLFTGPFASPAVSPDGTMIAFERVNDEGARDIWVFDVAQGTLAPLTFEGSPNRYPFWSPDSRVVGYSSEAEGLAALYSRPVDLSDEAQLLLADPAEALYEASWTPDGEYLVYRRGSGLTNGEFDIWYADPDVADSASPIVETAAVELQPSLSPDGRWLAYVSDESGQREVYVRRFPGPGGRVPISQDGGHSPVWGRSGADIYYIDGDGEELITASFRADSSFVVESREVLTSWRNLRTSQNHVDWDITPDDQRIIAFGPQPGVGGRPMVIGGFAQLLESGAGRN